jgi:hypothetical protein
MTVACDGGAGAQAGVRHREERAPPPNRTPHMHTDWRGVGWWTLQVHPPPLRPPSATRLRPWKGTLRPALAAPLPRRALLKAAVAAAPGVEAV